MKLIRSFIASAAIACSLALAGCSGGDTGAGADDEVTNEDVVDLGDLITADPDKAAAAAMVGDPATLLAEAKREAEVARGDVSAVFKFIHEVASGAPTKTGKTVKGGLPFAKWERDVEGASVRLSVVRTAPNRLRYLLQGKASDNSYLNLLTGIFIKKGPATGGGRFHVSLDNVSALYGAPNATGSVHFWFANHMADKRGRRILYKDVVRKDDPMSTPANFGADLVRVVGKGGRFRSVGVTDVIPELPGPELFAMRVLWKAAEGGRADAVLASLADPQSPVVLGHAHECWDAGGLRTAYADTDPMNDMDNPDEGDTSMCFALAQEDVPDSAATTSGTDNDPDLDVLLDDSGASDISEQEADVAEGAE
jgi:hypothetical protein